MFIHSKLYSSNLTLPCLAIRYIYHLPLTSGAIFSWSFFRILSRSLLAYSSFNYSRAARFFTQKNRRGCYILHKTHLISLSLCKPSGVFLLLTHTMSGGDEHLFSASDFIWWLCREIKSWLFFYSRALFRHESSSTSSGSSSHIAQTLQI